MHHESFLDDYSHVNREFDFFHPKHEGDGCDVCEFCHDHMEPSVLDCLHEFDTNSSAHGFASVMGFIFGIR